MPLWKEAEHTEPDSEAGPVVYVTPPRRGDKAVKMVNSASSFSWARGKEESAAVRRLWGDREAG